MPKYRESEHMMKQCVGFAFNAKLTENTAYMFAKGSFPSIRKTQVTAYYQKFEKERSRAGRRPAAQNEDLDEQIMNEIGDDPPVAAAEDILPEDEAANGNLPMGSNTTEQQPSLQNIANLSGDDTETIEKYDEIRIYLSSDAIKMIVKKEDEYCPVLQKKRMKLTNETVVMPANTIPEVLDQLGEIFNTPNLKIGLLKIITKDGTSFKLQGSREEELSAGILTNMSKLEWKLHVEKLSLEIHEPMNTQTDLLRIFDHLKPEMLQSFENNGVRDICIPKSVTDFINVSLNRGFLKFILSVNNLIDIPIVNLVNLTSYIDILISPPAVEDLITYKNNRLLFLDENCQKETKLHMFRFPTLSNPNMDQFYEALKPFTPVEDITKKSGYFELKNNRRLLFAIDPRSISFEVRGSSSFNYLC